MSKIKLQRIYDKSEDKATIRVLVDRLWPRGVSKERANLDYWLKELGPSHGLRKSFGHDAKRFAAFKIDYLAELKCSPQSDALEQLREIARNADRDLVLLFAAKEERYNHVQILFELLTDKNDEFS